MLRQQFGYSIVVLFQETDFWPKDPVAAGWVVRHPTECKVAMAWPRNLDGNVTSRVVSDRRTMAIRFKGVVVCNCYLPDDGKAFSDYSQQVLDTTRIVQKLRTPPSLPVVLGGI